MLNFEGAFLVLIKTAALTADKLITQLGMKLERL